MRTLIVDDTRLNREVILNFIQNYTPDLQVVGQANSMESAIESISKLNPELVLLDIELGDGTAFDVLEKLNQVDFHIIFITAYNHYALEAFKVNAVDYLLKPVKIDEFVQAVQKVKLKGQNGLAGILKAKNEIQSKKSELISVSTRSGFESININNLIRCQADGKYTNCILSDGRKILSSKNLKEFESMLIDRNFFRVHHGHLINLNHVLSFNRADSVVQMGNKEEVPISQRKKKHFIEEMNLI